MVYKGQRILIKNRRGFCECGYYARAQCMSMKNLLRHHDGGGNTN